VGQPVLVRSWSFYVLGSPSAGAPGASASGVGDCDLSLAELCPEVAAMPLDTLEASFAAQMCLMANKERLDPECRMYMNNEQNLVTACYTDITEHCDGVQPGNSRVHHCLQGHHDELSFACEAQIDRTAQRMSGEGVGGPLGRPPSYPRGASAPAFQLVPEPWLDDNLNEEPQFTALAMLFSRFFGDDSDRDDDKAGDPMPCPDMMLDKNAVVFAAGSSSDPDVTKPGAQIEGSETAADVSSPVDDALASVSPPSVDDGTISSQGVTYEEEEANEVEANEEQDEEHISFLGLLVLLTLVLSIGAVVTICVSVIYRAAQRARMQRMHDEFRKTYAPMLP